MLMRIGKEWWTDERGRTSWAKRDVMPLRTPREIVSGHEVFLHGYDQSKTDVFNSWGPTWADDGKNEYRPKDWNPYLVECIAITELPGEFLDAVEILPTKETFTYHFTINIKRENGGSDVEALQTALMIDGVFDRELYSRLLKNDELGFYGEITATAVRAFQRKYKVASEWEILTLRGNTVGPKTRAKLNSLYA